MGDPQNGWFIMNNPIKMDDLGVPLFQETICCKHRYLGLPRLALTTKNYHLQLSYSAWVSTLRTWSTWSWSNLTRHQNARGFSVKDWNLGIWSIYTIIYNICVLYVIYVLYIIYVLLYIYIHISLCTYIYICIYVYIYMYLYILY